jgi:hypothetical protein
MTVAAKRFQHCLNSVETFPAVEIVYTVRRQLERAGHLEQHAWGSL